MAFHSLKSLLVASLIGTACSSPVVPRGTSTTSVVSIQTVTVDHGKLDDAQIDKLRTTLSLVSASPATQTGAVSKRQTVAPSLTTATKGAFVAIDIGDPAVCGNSASPTVTAAGPIQTLQFSTGSSDMRSFELSSIGGVASSVKSSLDGSKDAGTFTFKNNERITSFFVFPVGKQFSGFNFTTSTGRTYAAMTDVGTREAVPVSVPVGSGILARVRAVPCSVGVIGSMGFDFIDELQSISISNISYSGFTNNILPADKGQNVVVGSQIIDNRNSSAEQTTSIQTTAAVTRSHSLSVSVGWQLGQSVSIEAEAGIPFITKSKATTSTSWSVQGSTDKQELTSETITSSATINLKCPAQKYCVGSSFFTIFKVDVNVEATFRAKTKSNQSFTWVQKGQYNGADSLALQLQIDQADRP